MARAGVRSIEALHGFRMALAEYQYVVLDSVTMLELELRKALDWIDLDRSNYWPDQVRRSSDNIVQFRNDLERCEMAIRAEDRKSCMVERKALERAKQRLKLCEKKVGVVKKWRIELHQQSSQMAGRLARIRDFIERELPNAIATMLRLIASLEQYAAVTDSPTANQGPSKTAEKSVSPSKNSSPEENVPEENVPEENSPENSSTRHAPNQSAKQSADGDATSSE